MESITFLRPLKRARREADGRLVTHRVSKLLDREGRVIEGFNAGARFVPVERTAAPEEMLTIIAEQAAEGETFLVHARPTANGRRHFEERGFLFRRSHPRDGEPADLEDQPSRVLPLDFDGVELASLDPRAPEPAFRELADKAGFPGVAVLGQLTSSQSPKKGSPGHLRLYIVTDRGLLAPERKRLQESVKQKLEAAGIDEHHLDDAMARTVQTIYIAPPEVEDGAPDPLPRRLFHLPGCLAQVNEEELRAVRPSARETTVGGHRVGVLPLGVEPLDHFFPPDLPELHDRLIPAAFHIARATPCTEEGLAAVIFDHLEPLCGFGGPSPRRPSREELRGEIARAVRWVLEQVTPSLIAGVSPEFPPVECHTLQEGERAVERGIVAAAGRRGRSILRVPTGVGKTEEVLQDARLLDLKLDIYVPDQGIARDLARRSRALGMTTLVLLGRDQRDAQGRPLCRKSETEKHLVEIGVGGLAPLLCETPISPRRPSASEFVEWSPALEEPFTAAVFEICPYAAECTYYRQFSEPAQVIIRQHATLPHRPSSLERRLRKADLVVIDESPLAHLIEKGRVPLAACTGPLAPIHTTTRVEDFDLEALKGVARGGFPSSLTPGMTADQALAAAAGVRATGAKLAEMILDCAAAGHEELPAVERVAGYVEFSWLRPIRRRGRSTLLLDATLRPAIAEAILPGAQVTTVTVDDNLAAIQVHDRTFSKSAAERGADCFAVAQEFLGHLREFGGEPAVVTHKDFAEDLRAAGFTSVEHFGALRGRDTLKGAPHRALLGRIQPRLEAVVQLARMLFPGERFPGARLVRRPAGYRMADASLVGSEDFYVTCEGPGAGQLAEVAASMREDEMLQGLGRFRAVRSEGRVPVWIFGGLPMDVTVQELIELQDVVEMNLLLQVLKEWQVVPLMPALLVKVAGDRFKTEKAAKRWLQKGVEENARRLASALRVREILLCREGPWKVGQGKIDGAPFIYETPRAFTGLDEARPESLGDEALASTRIEGPTTQGPCQFQPSAAPHPHPRPGAGPRLVVLDPAPESGGGRRVALVRFRLGRAHCRTSSKHLPLALVHAVDLIEAQRVLDRLLRKAGVRDAVFGVWPMPPVELDGSEVEDVAV